MSQDFIRQLDPTHNLRAGPSLSQRLHIDPVLTVMLMVFCCLGLFVLYSASEQSMQMVTRQSIYMLIGFVVMFTVAQIPPRYFQRLSPIAYLGGVVLLVTVLAMGYGAKGAQRWISLPGFRFQPSEIIKLALPLTVAAWLCRRPLPPSYKDTFIGLILIGLPVVLIAKQPDLGTSLMIGASGLFVLLLAGLRWRLIAGAVLLAIPAIWGMWHFVMREYQKQRVLTFLNPESDPWGSGWNIIPKAAVFLVTDTCNKRVGVIGGRTHQRQQSASSVNQPAIEQRARKHQSSMRYPGPAVWRSIPPASQ